MPRSRTKPAPPKRDAKKAPPRRRAASSRATRSEPPRPPLPLTFAERAHRYAQRVVAGEVIACRYVRLACHRHLRDLDRQSSADFPFVFDESRAEEFCAFAELLPHIKGPKAGQAFRLEDWQVFAACSVFGWVDPANGARRFRRFYIEVARGNGKSFLLAVIALYMLAADGESGGEIYSAATTRDQAKIVFKTAQEIVRRCPELRTALGVESQAHSISQASTASAFIALSAEDNTLDGLNTHFASVDELHAHKTRGVYDVLETSIAKRLQPLLGMITTAGSDRNGICYEVREDLVQILEGRASDDTFFGLVYTIDDGDDWKSEAVWLKANPNLDVSVNRATLRALAKKAERSPAARAAFLTKHLDVWVSVNAALFDAELWSRLADRALSAEEWSSEPCIVAADLAGKNDWSVHVRVHRRVDEETGKLRYAVFARHYTNEVFVADAKISPLPGWVGTPYLHVSPGNTIDQDEFAEEALEVCRGVNLVEAAIDMNYQGLAFAQRLQKNGIDPVVDCPITVKQLSQAVTELERLIRAGEIVHDGDPILAWSISNVVGHYDAKENVFPRKEKPEKKIDGAVATIMALSRWLKLGEDDVLDESPVSFL